MRRSSTRRQEWRSSLPPRCHGASRWTLAPAKGASPRFEGGGKWRIKLSDERWKIRLEVVRFPAINKKNRKKYSRKWHSAIMPNQVKDFRSLLRFHRFSVIHILSVMKHAAIFLGETAHGISCRITDHILKVLKEFAINHHPVLLLPFAPFLLRPPQKQKNNSPGCLGSLASRKKQDKIMVCDNFAEITTGNRDFAKELQP